MRLFSDHKISVTSEHVRHTLQFVDDIVKNFPDRLAGRGYFGDVHQNINISWNYFE